MPKASVSFYQTKALEGVHLPSSIAECLELHRDLTQQHDGIELQVRPAFLWQSEQQEPCKIAVFQMQLTDAEQEQALRCILNAAGQQYAITKQQVTLCAPFDGLEHIRLELLRKASNCR